MENVRARYSIAEVWKEIRPKQEKVVWHRLLWSYLAIPKHSIITWMAILNRLSTMDRLISWGIEMGAHAIFFIMILRLEIIFFVAIQ